jgi:hypothetical protein
LLQEIGLMPIRIAGMAAPLLFSGITEICFLLYVGGGLLPIAECQATLL